MLLTATGIDALNTNLVEGVVLSHIEVDLSIIEVVVLSESIGDDGHVGIQFLIVRGPEGQRTDFLLDIDEELPQEFETLPRIDIQPVQRIETSGRLRRNPALVQGVQENPEILKMVEYGVRLPDQRTLPLIIMVKRIK